MDTKRMALYLGRTRAGLGVAMMIAPRLTLRPWMGSGIDGPVPVAAARMMGGRDFVLGAGAAIAIGEGHGGASWVSMGAVADGVDALVALASPGLPWRARILAVLAGGSAVAHFLLARELGKEETARL